jgi:hypothetical protein
LLDPLLLALPVRRTDQQQLNWDPSMAKVLVVFAAILLGLAAPSAIRRNSWPRLVSGSVVAFFAVVFPLFVFWFSAVLAPEWKGDCEFGWMDCLHTGKLALTPIVIWATAALYAVEVYEVEYCGQKWIVLGLFLGAIVAAGCLLFGLVSCCAYNWHCHVHQFPNSWPVHRAWVPLLVPFYVALWYGIRAVRFMKISDLELGQYLTAICGSVPLWFVAVIWSRRIHENLPSDPPRHCFVVTAASCGHRRFVGPFVEVPYRGRSLQANRQLLTMWQFESLWRSRLPRSHALFRRVYNRLGPPIARRLVSPWLADATYMLLKPVELLARVAIRLFGARESDRGRDSDGRAGTGEQPV